ncbi:S-layer homology domain-containing protein [Paenibacillus sp. UNCCL117]|uniref:S-layer homology domain-containing protein n=1 Tax=unclassified Paenibacillus TaxID=185978 RepID=UPI000886E60F|nr:MULTISPECIES: S-layer homology domain-containing protein [unclassified Paenibacillus]SDE62344.1 S-layer homology domain-containing protein [Paenibacillus sp. cl123]SFW69926.1 S-layer homology domain-containing protein [Paenibacillus sp. UNCCL117]
MRKRTALALIALLLSSMTVGSAFAFTDVEDGQREAVTALKERGVVSGIDQEHFAPKGRISYAQSVQMIVKAMDLNLDLMKFAKPPLASDHYANVPDEAWYADAFVIAHYHGLELPKDINPNASITREQFGDLLVRALEKKGDFPLIKMFIQIQDEDQLTPELQGTIQRALLYKIVELDQAGRFHPKSELTRGEAAVWVHNAVRVLETHVSKPAPAPEPAPVPQADIAISTEKVNEEVNKITLTWELRPNPGYGMEITGIRFEEGNRAVVLYKLHAPDPDKMYPQVITPAQVSTFIPAGYKASAELAN